jgi:hypothetical protein
MSQNTPESVSPFAPFEGSFAIPGFDLARRWFDARDLTPERSAKILDVIRIAFNQQPRWFALPVSPADHFDWKFRDRPTGATAHLTVETGGRVVGFTGGVRRIWFVNGIPCVSRAGYDLSLLPEWQGRGVQRARRPSEVREWHPSEDLGLGYVTHPADRHLAIEAGNRSPANETHDYVRYLRPLTRLRQRTRTALRRNRQPAGSTSNTSAVIQQQERSRFDRMRSRARRAAAYARSLLTRRPPPRGVSWTVSTLSRFDQRHEPFIDAALSQFDFVGERPISYLNWRYCDRRAGPFIVRIAEEDGALLGFAVTRVLDGNAQLADILTLPGRADVAESLIRDAIQLAGEGDASVITTRLPKRHPYRPALARAGFFDIGHVAGELIAARGMPDDDLAFLDSEDARIHLVYADSDSV